MFRGAALSSSEIKYWKDHAMYNGNELKVSKSNEFFFQGFTSTTEVYSLALEFAKMSESLGRHPVVFVICIANYQAGMFMRMNSPSLSAYSHEREVLLSEGTYGYVLKVVDKSCGSGVDGEHPSIN